MRQVKLIAGNRQACENLNNKNQRSDTFGRSLERVFIAIQKLK